MTPLEWFAGISVALAAFFTAIFRRYYNPPEQEPIDLPTNPQPMPTPAPVVPPVAPVSPVEPSIDHIPACALAQMSFEGWYLPGSLHNGIRYPEGSGSYARNNPGNIKQKNPDGSTSFIVFATFEEGFAALENYIRRVATGKHPAYPKGGATTIMEYTHIYTGDAEPSPTNYANAIAKAVNLSTSSKMSELLT